jgi:hypothetical protein
MAATDSAPIPLTSRRLSVDIAHPGTAYAGTRFDWTGFVTQVTLDNVHTFCVPESLVPGQGTGGIGICNEYGIDIGTGYADAGETDLFPKFGIGLLEHGPKAEYSFWDAHPIAQPFPIELSHTETSATFTMEPLECRGYAARLVKTLTVMDNRLEIAYRMENTGSKPIQTNEYVHNFIGINNQPLGPEYTVKFPYPVRFEKFKQPPRGWMRYVPGFVRERLMQPWVDKMIEPLEVTNDRINIKHTPKTPFYCRMTGFGQTDQPQWELRRLTSGVSMREYDDFGPCRVAMWGTEHVISVEVFVDIDIQPGQSQSWTRWMEFNA